MMVYSDGVGLGLKLRTNRSQPSKTMMMSNSHLHHDLQRPSSSVASNCDDPTCNNSEANEVAKAITQLSTCTNVSNMYDVVVGPVNCGAVVVRTLQPFHTSNYTTAFKSPGTMAAKLEFPFTSAQREELETQAMTYKYMMASMPEPLHLLLPLTTNFPAHPSTATKGGYVYNWRCTNNGDLEPGRCKRTDGKKWRCSREVAPNQKYCERHMHRGRPRSRKPVEVHTHLNNNNKKIRLENSPQNIAATVVANSIAQSNGSIPHQMLGPNLVFPETNTDLRIKASTNRDIGWVMEDKMVGTNDGFQQQWPHLMDDKIGLTSIDGLIYDSNNSLFEQDYEGDQPLSPFCYTDLIASRDLQHQIDRPRGAIDVWSSDDLRTTTTTNTGDSSVSLSQVNFSLPSLTQSLAMAAGNDLDEEMAKIQEGCCLDNKAKDSTPASSTPCWVPVVRDGPLAEVLHSGSSAATPNPASPVTWWLC